MHEVNVNAFNDLWPFNMVNQLNYFSNIDIGNITINGVNAALATIDERDREALYLRFKSGLTYEAIGQKFNLTRERARQLVHRGLEHLNLKRDLMLTVPMNKYKSLDRRYSILQDDVNKYKAIAENRQERDMSHYERRIRKIIIEEMEFGVRAYNCLTRAGVKTLKDLTELTEDDLMKIRNIGVKTYEEIVSKMAMYNATLSPNKKLTTDNV